MKVIERSYRLCSLTRPTPENITLEKSFCFIFVPFPLNDKSIVLAACTGTKLACQNQIKVTTVFYFSLKTLYSNAVTFLK